MDFGLSYFNPQRVRNPLRVRATPGRLTDNTTSSTLTLGTLPLPPAVIHMIVHDTHRLHEGIADSPS